RYKDRDRTPDGLDTIALKSGEETKAKVIVRGKGPHLALPTLPLGLPLQVLLVADGGACWQSTFSAGGMAHNDTGQVKADSDRPLRPGLHLLRGHERRAPAPPQPPTFAPAAHCRMSLASGFRMNPLLSARFTAFLYSKTNSRCVG